jgi:formiminoglutamase
MISGFGFDEGVQAIGGRVGSERGPQAFLYSLKTSLLIPTETMQDYTLYDTGIIYNNLLDHQLSLSEAHSKLEAKNAKLLAIPDSVVFAIGGSNDQSYPNFKALSTHSSKVGVINIGAHFNVKALPKDSLDSASVFRFLLEDKQFSEGNKNTLTQFASQGSQCSKTHSNYLKLRDAEIIYLNDIRRWVISEEYESRTQAGQRMEKLLKELEGKVDTIFFSLNLDSINSAFCPGVSDPAVIGGLSDEEALELGYLAGKNAKVRLMDVSEFNPAVEDKRTAKLIVTIFYCFVMGLTKRVT